MVLLAITAAGLTEALRREESEDLVVWCGADAISESAYDSLMRPLSRFDYELKDDAFALEDALETIELHHPNQVVLVEDVGAPNPSFQRTATPPLN